jgi:hypothetical protein
VKPAAAEPGAPAPPPVRARARKAPVMPAAPAPPLKRGGRPHRVLALLAAHPDGLISRQLAELDGSGTGQRMPTRYGDALRALRDRRNAGTPPPGVPVGRRGSAPKPRRRISYRTGAGIQGLRCDSAACTGTPRYPGPALRREAALAPQPEWAAEAARRYRDGEPRSALCTACKVSDRRMTRVLQAEGVALRGLRETLRLRASPARQPGPQPDGQLPDHTPASAFPALGEAM